jgi:hypothetical protein
MVIPLSGRRDQALRGIYSPDLRILVGNTYDKEELYVDISFHQRWLKLGHCNFFAPFSITLEHIFRLINL